MNAFSLVILGLGGCAITGGVGVASRDGGAVTSQIGGQLYGVGSHHFGLAGTVAYRSVGTDGAGLVGLYGRWESGKGEDLRPGFHAQLGVRAVLDGNAPYPIGPAWTFGYHSRYLFVQVDYGYARAEHDVVLVVGFDPIRWAISGYANVQ